MTQKTDLQNGPQASGDGGEYAGDAHRAIFQIRAAHGPVDRPSGRLSSGGALIVVWIVTGPVFHYSDTWQLVINTGTTIVTFLMAFRIQNMSIATPRRCSQAVRTGAGDEGGGEQFAAIEDLSDKELEHCTRNAAPAPR